MDTFFATTIGVAFAGGGFVYASYAIVHTDWYIEHLLEELPLVNLLGWRGVSVCFLPPALALLVLTIFSTTGLIASSGALGAAPGPRITFLAAWCAYSLIGFLFSLLFVIYFYIRVHRARRRSMVIEEWIRTH